MIFFSNSNGRKYKSRKNNKKEHHLMSVSILRTFIIITDPSNGRISNVFIAINQINELLCIDSWLWSHSISIRNLIIDIYMICLLQQRGSNLGDSKCAEKNADCHVSNFSYWWLAFQIVGNKDDLGSQSESMIFRKQKSIV